MRVFWLNSQVLWRQKTQVLGPQKGAKKVGPTGVG